MARPVVYALYASAEAAAPAMAALAAHDAGRQPLSAQLHAGRLDPLALPEGATSVGRNNLIAVGAGGLIGLVLGVGAASFVHIPGLGPGAAAGIGLVTGVLVGSMSAVMSGARDPLPALAELAPRLGEGATLVTVELPEGADPEAIDALLEAHDPEYSGRC